MDEDVDMEKSAGFISKSGSLNAIDILNAYGEQDEAPDSTMKYLHRFERGVM